MNVPSAQAPRVVHYLDATDISEAGEHALQLFFGDFIIKISDVDNVIRRRWVGGRSLIAYCRYSSAGWGRRSGGLILCSFLDRSEVLFDGCFRCSLREAFSGF
jgi:hypothetical protein